MAANGDLRWWRMQPVRERRHRALETHGFRATAAFRPDGTLRPL